MLQLIGLFFPAFLSLAVYDSLGADKNVEKDSRWNKLKYYGMFTLLDVTTASFAEKLLKPSINFVGNGNLTNEFLSVSYLIFAVVFAILWGYCIRILKGVFQIQIEERSTDEEKEKAEN